MKHRLLLGFIYLSICIKYGSKSVDAQLAYTFRQTAGGQKMSQNLAECTGVKLRSPIMLLIFYIIWVLLISTYKTILGFGVLDGVGLATTLSGAHRSCEQESRSLFLLGTSGEVNEEGKPFDGHESVGGVLAHVVSVSVVETEVVKGSDGESSPGSGTNETVPSVLDGFTELLTKEGGVGLLDDSESDEGELDELVGEGDVSVHGAGKFFRHYN